MIWSLKSTSVKPGDVDYISLIEVVTLMGGLGKMLFWSLPSVKTIPLQMFRPVQLVILAAKGKTGFGSLTEKVTLMREL